jgi:uncharacterized membrane protein
VLTRRDEGSLALLVIGYTFIAAVLVVVGVDVSKVFLAQRALSSAADSAALAGAQAVDRAAVYAGAADCTGLPIDAVSAHHAVEAALSDAGDSLRGTFVSLSDPDVQVEAGRVQVRLHGQVTVPFGRVLTTLLPDHSGGRVDVSADAAASSALSSPAC